MQKVFCVFPIWLSLMLPGTRVLSDTVRTQDAESLLKLAPRISLTEQSISTFYVTGTLDSNGILLRFIVSAKQPDQVALRILDARDDTPITVGIVTSFMFYDPISSEVVVGRATPTFTLGVEKDPEATSPANPDPLKLVMDFSFHCVNDEKEGDHDDSKATVIDLRSFLASLVKPLKVTTEDNKHFVLSGFTKRGNKTKAYVTPSRKEGPYTRMELYQSGKDKAFLVLDEIVLNQPLPAASFVFPEEKLLTAALPISEISDDGLIKTVLSIGRLVRGIMARLVLAGVDDSHIKSAVEKMSMREIDWKELKTNDKKVGIILRSILEEGGIEPAQKEDKPMKASPSEGSCAIRCTKNGV